MATGSPSRSLTTMAAPASTAGGTSSASASYEDDLRNKVFEGQLNKFTNVVQGWQYRWFILRPDTGNLDYYLMDEGKHGHMVIGKHRASQSLVSTMVIPSDEDSQAFSVVFASGETYKLRASSTRERQLWVDRIRHVSQVYEKALAHNHHHVMSLAKVGTPPAGSKSHILSNGNPSDALQTLSLSVLDAFGSVHDILQQTDGKHQNLARSIEKLPLRTTPTQGQPSKTGDKNPSCLDEDLLVLKATSQAALQCLESALAVLQELQEVNGGQKVAKSSTITTKSIFPTSPMAISPRRSIVSSLGLSKSGGGESMTGLSTFRFGGSSQSINMPDHHFNRLGCGDNISIKSVPMSAAVPASTAGGCFLTAAPVGVELSGANLSTSTPSVHLAAGRSADTSPRRKKSSTSADRDKSGQGS